MASMAVCGGARDGPSRSASGLACELWQGGKAAVAHAAHRHRRPARPGLYRRPTRSMRAGQSLAPCCPEAATQVTGVLEHG